MSEKVLLPFRYSGGKYYALKYLRPYWEAVDHDEYREPFLGGGSVFWGKPKCDHNWLNDIDDDLIFTLKFIKNKKKALEMIDLFKDEVEATKEKHSEVKKMIPQSDLDRAYKYFYLNRTSFSGKMNNPTFGYRPKRSLPPRRWDERVIPCGEKLSGVKLTSSDFEEVIKAKPKGKKVLMFLDPPYFKPKAGSHYKHSFKEEDHLRLATTLKETNYKFFLTYDDCPEVRKLYKWANIYKLNFFYRVSNSRHNGDSRQIGQEIVITNYNMDKYND